jgi:hypothetical protein
MRDSSAVAPKAVGKGFRFLNPTQGRVTQSGQSGTLTRSWSQVQILPRPPCTVSSVVERFLYAEDVVGSTPTPCTMCRYGIYSEYRSHHVCLECRCSRKEYGQSGVRCNKCGQEMAWAGHDFRPPRQANKRAWEAVVTLLSSGVRYHSCGCGGPGYRPTNPREAEKMAERQRKREHRDRLWRARPFPYTYEDRQRGITQDPSVYGRPQLNGREFYAG